MVGTVASSTRQTRSSHRPVLGRVSASVMAKVDEALRLHLQL